jgi:hypothetical protein
MTAQPIHRTLFVATILTGSFLLFLIQPMVARMALPRLGGAPNVWNSAMLVYQALLLAGYGYAHWLGRFAVTRQATIHISLLLLAGLTLPIAIADLTPPSPGSEAWWVPLLFLVSIGPVFFLVSAQAPLMQRWFAAHPGAGEPWALYAASNLGSFAGLIAYPLLAEPLLRLHAQSVAWSVGYGVLVALVALAAGARWQLNAATVERSGSQSSLSAEGVGSKNFLHWTILAAVPSGLMLSTTTHLTTDVVAMPLLWVIPLGIYLLSFVVAFADHRRVADWIMMVAPFVLLLAGGMAMSSRSNGTLVPVLGSVALLLVVAVALHGKMYALRPSPEHLTVFYLAMSLGGALGGLFTALIAPLLFDWVWEHPLLVLVAALLMPLPRALDWRRMPGLDPMFRRVTAALLLGTAAFLATELLGTFMIPELATKGRWLAIGTAVAGLALVPWRWMFVSVLGMMMLAQGGIDTVQTTAAGLRSRSYFGIYTVRDYEETNIRTLAHGTTLHGQQSLNPEQARQPMSYYGPSSGVAIALGDAQKLYGQNARIGVVGLGTGTLACFKKSAEQWRIFEIDPAVVRYSQDRTFTFVSKCAPDAQMIVGDARIKLAQLPKGSLDMLVIDAFSSDSIPLHLMTDEAFGVYLDALAPKGMLVLHISNRFIELEPAVAALARHRRLDVMKREDNPADRTALTPSTWLALSRDPAMVSALAEGRVDMPWANLMPPAKQVWSDDHASILPFVRWEHILKTP